MNRIRLLFPFFIAGVVTVVVVVSNLPRTAQSAVPVAPPTCGPCGMKVDPEEALNAWVSGQRKYYCSPACRDSEALGGGNDDGKAEPQRARLVDVVCGMEVNATWNIRSDYRGHTYYFCADRCRGRFEKNAAHFLTHKCLVCATPLVEPTSYPATYLGKTYHLCSEDHRRAFKADPAGYFMHSMWGIPSWLYYVSIALVLVVSFEVFDRLSRVGTGRSPLKSNKAPRRARVGADQIRGEGERLSTASPRRAMSTGAPAVALPVLGAFCNPVSSVPSASAGSDRFDLLSISWIRIALRSRTFRFAVQGVVSFLFVLVIACGLFGNQNPSLNIAPILTWTIWWTLLIVLIMFAGKAWCYVCPWDAIAGWTEKLALWRKNDDGLSLGLKWPHIVRNIAIATICFVGLTWIELGFGVTMKPRVTAYLAVGMLLMAMLSALLFDRKSFCRYGCLVGRVSGLYAMFGGVEVRSRSAAVCRSCHSKECVKGSETAYGCPTFLYPGKLRTNTYCIQCMECVQACPHDNMAVNLRPWGSDLAVEGKPRRDEAYLALLMLAITGFHGLTMTPAWQQLIDGFRGMMGVGRLIGFSTGMALLMLGPIGIYAVLVAGSKRLADVHAVKPFTYKDYFIRYAYAMLPIALFYHIAHNLEHLLMEGPKVLAIMSDPFGWGWNLFGTAGWTIPPMISLDKLWLVQVLLVLVGHVYSLWVAQKTSLRLFGSGRAAFRSQLPMLAGMIAFSVISLWLLKQPMEMRTSAM